MNRDDGNVKSPERLPLISIAEDPGVRIGPNYKWAVVAMLWFIAFFNYADRQALSAVSGLVIDEFKLSEFWFGMLGSAFMWVYGLGAPFAGFVVDRVRRKTAIMGGLFAWCTVCALTSASPSFWFLFFFCAAEGLGETFYFPASMSLISDYHGKRTRSRAMGFHQTSVYIGTIGGSTFAGLIGQYYGWRWSYFVFGIAGILLGVALFRFLREPKRGAADFADAGRPEARARQKMSLLEFARLVRGRPTALLLMLAFMCANFVAAVLLTWMPRYLNKEFHMNLAMAGFSATVYLQLASMIGAPCGGWIADKLRSRTPRGRMIVQMAGLLSGAPFVLLCGLTHSVMWLIVALTAWGFFKGLYDANIFASVYDVVPAEARGTTAGFMNMFGWLCGGAMAPPLIGFIAQKTTLGFAIATASSVYILAALLLLTGILLFVKRDVARLQASMSSAQ
jgi:MFS family permease